MVRRYLLCGALLLSFLTASANALENVSSTPEDNARRASEAQIKSTPSACVTKTQDKAAIKCPIACQVSVPTTKLATADSCADRTWECRWPRQSVAKTDNCPAGWSGTLTKEEIYEVQSCGSKLADTGEFTVTATGCTRTFGETKTESCPTGGDWTGNGITYARGVTEKLEPDLSTTTTVSTTAWTVSKVECTRVVNQEDYTLCPLPSTNTCKRIVMQTENKFISGTCPGQNPPANANVKVTPLTQQLDKDKVTAVTTAAGTATPGKISCYTPCNLPWGGTLDHGKSITAYTAENAANCQTIAQTRTCTDGTLSGNASYGTCTNVCNLPWGGTINSGQSVTAYASSNVNFGDSCANYAQTRTCANGTLSGSNTYSTCTVAAPANCALPWGGTITHGQSITAYAASSVPYGQSCAGQTRTCNNGSLSGSYGAPSCNVQPGASCTMNWYKAVGTVVGPAVQQQYVTSVGHGQTITAYAEPHDLYGPCAAQNRTCNNGSLSGSYRYDNCYPQN